MRVRPLARRPARIARPARVRIRSRKPCVFARRRLLGWKVRFMVWLLGEQLGKSDNSMSLGRNRAHGQTDRHHHYRWQTYLSDLRANTRFGSVSTGRFTPVDNAVKGPNNEE